MGHDRPYNTALTRVSIRFYMNTLKFRVDTLSNNTILYLYFCARLEQHTRMITMNTNSRGSLKNLKMFTVTALIIIVNLTLTINKHSRTFTF